MTPASKSAHLWTREDTHNTQRCTEEEETSHKEEERDKEPIKQKKKTVITWSWRAERCILALITH